MKISLSVEDENFVTMKISLSVEDENFVTMKISLSCLLRMKISWQSLSVEKDF
jgi:hypothetical protein